MRNRVLLITATFLALNFNVYSNPIEEFGKKTGEDKISSQDIATFLRKNQEDPSLCTSIHLDLTVWHDEEYNPAPFGTVCETFLKLLGSCKQSESEKNNMGWIELIGSPCKDIFDVFEDNDGIHGNVSLNFDEKNQLNVGVMFYHDDEYNQDVWKRIVEISVDYLEKCTPEDELDESVQRYECLGPIFRDTIAATADEKTVHSLLKATWKDGDNSVCSWYSN